MQFVMERDVEDMLGPRYHQAEGRRGWHWGKERSWCRHRRAEGTAGSTESPERRGAGTFRWAGEAGRCGKEV